MGLLLGVLANLIGGSTFVLHKFALEGWPPAILILVRTLIGLPLLLALFRRGSLALATREDWWRMLVVGVLGLGVPHLVGIYGLAHSSSLNAALLIGIEPVTIVAASWLILKERISGAELAGIIAALLGAALVVTEGRLSTTLSFEGNTTGNLLLLGHGMLWAIYTLASKPTLQRVPAATFTVLVTIVSLVLLVPAALLETGALDWERASRPAPLFAMLALGVVVSFGGTLLWALALERLSATRMAALIFLQPVTGALLGLALGDPATPAVWIGGALVLAGVYLAQLHGPLNA